MALKKLVRKRKPRPSVANVIIATLKRFGVSAPVTTAAGITQALRTYGYDIKRALRI
jgi:hypothetical protein